MLNLNSVWLWLWPWSTVIWPERLMTPYTKSIEGLSFYNCFTSATFSLQCLGSCSDISWKRVTRLSYLQLYLNQMPFPQSNLLQALFQAQSTEVCLYQTPSAELQHFQAVTLFIMNHECITERVSKVNEFFHLVFIIYHAFLCFRVTSALQRHFRIGFKFCITP